MRKIGKYMVLLQSKNQVIYYREKVVDKGCN
jgi:hypothetical protein